MVYLVVTLNDLFVSSGTRDGAKSRFQCYCLFRTLVVYMLIVLNDLFVSSEPRGGVQHRCQILLSISYSSGLPCGNFELTHLQERSSDCCASTARTRSWCATSVPTITKSSTPCSYGTTRRWASAPGR